MPRPTPYPELLHYRRAVSELYGWLRQSALPPAERWAAFRRRRDALFASHPQSALSAEQQATFTGLPYYPYDPAWRFVLPIERDVAPAIIEISLEADGLTRMRRFGRITFNVAGRTVSLSLFWILGYGGGVFLPFRDRTNGQTTYGGGRYLLDTIKHADLGQEGERLIIDFNYAYNPSCAYNPRWHCPLAPRENWLDLAIPAGEKAYS